MSITPMHFDDKIDFFYCYYFSFLQEKSLLIAFNSEEKN